MEISIKTFLITKWSDGGRGTYRGAVGGGEGGGGKAEGEGGEGFYRRFLRRHCTRQRGRTGERISIS